MNQPPPNPQGTRHLVAPELLSALDAFPSFDIDLETIAALRIGGDRAPQVEVHNRLRRDALARAFLASSRKGCAEPADPP